MKVQSIAIGLLRSNPSNPRDMQRDQDLDSLAASITQSGIIVPLIVRKSKDEDGTAAFEVLAGHRRLMAAEGILEELPCIVTAEEQGTGVVLALIENTQRVDLSGLETARAIDAALKGGMKQKDMAAAIGRAPSYVSKMVKIMKAVRFLEGKGTDTAYMGDYTNYEELYEHAREVLGELKPKNEQPDLPGTKGKDEGGESNGRELTDAEALEVEILKHAKDSKVKLEFLKISDINASNSTETIVIGTTVQMDFKSIRDAEKFFLTYVSSSK